MMRYRLILSLFWSIPLIGSAAHGQDGKTEVATYIGSRVCAECHSREFALWRGSHHDLAMQVANDETVLGDFDDATLTHFGIETRFYRDGDRFMVHTDGPDGALQDFEIKFAFGAVPLQQYLVPLSGGRLQALGVAWDSRAAEEGGQRWFHLYPDERVGADDPLHWTGPDQTWNYMCADCHSTNLRRRYDADSDSYDTQWSEINVACEACHGPGSDHRHWAEKRSGWEQLASQKGLAARLDGKDSGHWAINPDSGRPLFEGERNARSEIDTCAPCHSRRATIWSESESGESYLDRYLPQLLHRGMYFADGQIRDEVYVYGSFLQSRMYREGVICSDCHQPHSLELRAPGNGVCLQCHGAERYDTHAHHFHAGDAAQPGCVDCHMPARTYMVVDPRRDHSFRIPRPELSATLGTPDVCTDCHSGRSPGWAASQLRTWYGHKPTGYQNFAEAFANARSGQPAAGEDLFRIATDVNGSAIARATALSEMSGYFNRETVDALVAGAIDADPLLRVAAVGALESAPLELRMQLAFPLLSDPIRAVRLEAARVLAPVPRGALTGEQVKALEAAGREYELAQLVNAERPEAQMNLANYYGALGLASKAESALRRALELQPEFVPAYVNLADLYRALDRDQDGERVLETAVELAPESADARHALGLLLVRKRALDAALVHLGAAARLEPENARFGFVYGVALESAGRLDDALDVLRGVHERYPYDRDTLEALVAYLRNAGRVLEAADYAEKLQALSTAGG